MATQKDIVKAVVQDSGLSAEGISFLDESDEKSKEKYQFTEHDKTEWDRWDYLNKADLMGGPKELGREGKDFIWRSDELHDFSKYWNYDKEGGPRSTSDIHGVGWLPTNQEVSRSKYLVPEDTNWEYTKFVKAPWNTGGDIRSQAPHRGMHKFDFEFNQPQTYGWDSSKHVTTGKTKRYTDKMEDDPDDGRYWSPDRWDDKFAVEILDFDKYSKDFKYQAALKKLRGVEGETTRPLQFRNVQEIVDARAIMTGTYQAPAPEAPTDTEPEKPLGTATNLITGEEEDLSIKPDIVEAVPGITEAVPGITEESWASEYGSEEEAKGDWQQEFLGDDYGAWLTYKGSTSEPATLSGFASWKAESKDWRAAQGLSDADEVDDIIEDTRKESTKGLYTREEAEGIVGEGQKIVNEEAYNQLVAKEGASTAVVNLLKDQGWTSGTKVSEFLDTTFDTKLGEKIGEGMTLADFQKADNANVVAEAVKDSSNFFNPDDGKLNTTGVQFIEQMSELGLLTNNPVIGQLLKDAKSAGEIAGYSEGTQDELQRLTEGNEAVQDILETMSPTQIQGVFNLAKGLWYTDSDGVIRSNIPEPKTIDDFDDDVIAEAATKLGMANLQNPDGTISQEVLTKINADPKLMQGMGISGIDNTGYTDTHGNYIWFSDGSIVGNAKALGFAEGESAGFTAGEAAGKEGMFTQEQLDKQYTTGIAKGKEGMYTQQQLDEQYTTGESAGYTAGEAAGLKTGEEKGYQLGTEDATTSRDAHWQEKYNQAVFTDPSNTQTWRGAYDESTEAIGEQDKVIERLTKEAQEGKELSDRQKMQILQYQYAQNQRAQIDAYNRIKGNRTGLTIPQARAAQLTRGRQYTSPFGAFNRRGLRISNINI